MTNFDPSKLTAQEYAAQRPAKGLRRERVSSLVRQAYVQRGRITELRSDGRDLSALVRWDGGDEGFWPLWLLRSERPSV